MISVIIMRRMVTQVWMPLLIDAWAAGGWSEIVLSCSVYTGGAGRESGQLASIVYGIRIVYRVSALLQQPWMQTRSQSFHLGDGGSSGQEKRI